MSLKSRVFLLFPHQLFADTSCIPTGARVLLIEEFLFFRQYPFHKKKLLFQRAAMHHHKAYLQSEGFSVEYIYATQQHNDIRELIPDLHEAKVTHIDCFDPCDYWLEKRLRTLCTEKGIILTKHPSPAFILTEEEARASLRGLEKFHQSTFYIQQRKKQKLLLATDGKPLGGKWSFDAENREPYPSGKKPPSPKIPASTPFLQDAIKTIERDFPDHPGNLSHTWYFPLTHRAAEEWLTDFLETRFRDFGIYEDAIVRKEWLLHHSLLSPLLNIGLLTPHQVLEKTLAFADKNQIPLNSLEGFVRQITGWREYIRAVYVSAGNKQRTTNYWKFRHSMPKAFYTAETGMAPADDCIRKVIEHSYNHHIERLMVLSNLMLLCEIHPDAVYRWFMELYADAWDWVMVPNVYGMAQFADGGLMCTKPYISGSRYLLQMSDYSKKDAWTTQWDALYWRFIHEHRNFFQGNPRLSLMPALFDKFPEEKKRLLLSTAEQYLKKIHS